MKDEPLIYHALPPQMLGETLYPLRELGNLSPERYRTELAKYDDHPDRRKIPRGHIAKLNCAKRRSTSRPYTHTSSTGPGRS